MRTETAPAVDVKVLFSRTQENRREECAEGNDECAGSFVVCSYSVNNALQSKNLARNGYTTPQIHCWILFRSLYVDAAGMNFLGFKGRHTGPSLGSYEQAIQLWRI